MKSLIDRDRCLFSRLERHCLAAEHAKHLTCDGRTEVGKEIIDAYLELVEKLQDDKKHLNNNNPETDYDKKRKKAAEDGLDRWLEEAAPWFERARVAINKLLEVNL